MERSAAALVGSRVTRMILESVHDHLANPDFDLDEGEVQFIDRDEGCLYFGFFETDVETGNTQGKPCLIWTVEVSAALE